MRNLKNKFNTNTFIYNYMDYCENLETATDFDFWGAIWILSLLCNRNFVINRPNSPIFPNFFITLIADSGIARKSTAINFAKSIIENENNLIISSPMSVGKFNHALSELTKQNNECIIAINCSEFITFYKNKSIIECLTDLYDCPKERKGYGTFNNGNINIRNIFISSYTGSTPNYYIKAVNEDEIEGGFTSRNIIVFAERGKKRIAWGTDKTTINIEQLKQITNQIRFTISKIKGAINLSPKAITRYSKWYERRRLSDNLYLKSFESREQDHILKLASLLAINDNETEIQYNHIDLAINIIKDYKLKAYNFFSGLLYKEDNDDLSKLITKIINYIYISGENGIYHKVLYSHIRQKCDAETLNLIINIMHELNMIEMLQPYKSKAMIYRATKLIKKIKIKDIINNIKQ